MWDIMHWKRLLWRVLPSAIQCSSVRSRTAEFSEEHLVFFFFRVEEHAQWEVGNKRASNAGSFACLILLHWRLRRYVSPKPSFTSNGPHALTSLKIQIQFKSYRYKYIFSLQSRGSVVVKAQARRSRVRDPTRWINFNLPNTSDGTGPWS
jgi:hypothetical protein